MKKSYWLYKMCLLLGLGICIPVTGNASDIGDATLTQQQSKITASGVVVDESGESLIGASVIESRTFLLKKTCVSSCIRT